MKNNHFDIEIKKMLADMEVPFQGQHWDAMAQRLKETTVPNDSESLSVFDKTISSKVKSFEVPFNESNWVALRQRLVANAYLKKWILHTKVFESVTMLLLALTFISVADFSNTTETPTKRPATKDVPAKAAPIPKYDGPIASVESENDQVLEVVQMMIVESNVEHKTLSDRYDGILPLLPALPASTYGNKNSFLKYTNEVANIEAVSIFAKAKDVLARLENDGLDLPQILPMKTGTNKKFGLSVYAALNADHIKTGRDATYNIDIPDLWSSGYGAGVALHKQVGKHIFNVGLAYQEIKYLPKPIVLISEGNASEGYAGSGTSSVKVAIAKVPVSIGYAFVDNSRHRIALNVGVSAGIGSETFSQSTFVVASQNANNKTKLKAQAAAATQSSAYTQNPNSAGEIISNSYQSKSKFFAFANAGLDYEFKLSKKHSLFAQASYQRQISKKGIGMPNDKVNSVGIQLGLRAYL